MSCENVDGKSSSRHKIPTAGWNRLRISTVDGEVINKNELFPRQFRQGFEVWAKFQQKVYTSDE